MKRQSYERFLALAGVVFLSVAVAVPARAQDPDDQKRGVARISLMNGDVTVRRGDSGEWVAGVINAPLLTDDRVATGQNSRAEVQFDASNILRVGGNAEVRLAQLEAGVFHFEIARGTVTYRVLQANGANVELATPSVAIRPAKEGTFRITVNDAGETEITARTGDIEVFTPGGSQWVYAGQTMMAHGNSSDPEFQMVSAVPNDDWDRWNDARDRVLLQSTSSQYVPQGVYGTEDLDSAGAWTYVAPYGNVWRPTAVAADWSPYRNGRWAWEDWYGWTWVSYDSWGWAPYHYGRWFNQGGYGWCWYPGAFGMRQYWSPALVAFFGFGHGVGVGFGFGHMGWVPLAPYETFHPWWGRGFYGRDGFNRSINISNVNITNNYRNARVTNGISSVRADDFRGGRFNSIGRPSGTEVAQAGLIRGQMPISGTNVNRRFSDRTVTNTPRTNENLRFFSRQQTNPQAGRAAGPAGGQGIGAQNAIRPSGQAQPQSGLRRFGEPGGANGGVRSTGPATGTPAYTRPAQPSGNSQPANGRTGGFRRFGEPGSNQQAPARQPYNPPQQNQQNRSNPASGPGGGRAYSPAPSYSAPRQAPSYNAPRQAPSYSAPRQAPSYSAPRSAPSYSAPQSSRPSGGGGGSRSSGGGSRGGGRR